MANQSLILFLLSLAAAGIVWLGFKSGYAHFSFGVEPDRRRNPIAFWLVQTFFGFMGLAALFGSVHTLLRGA